METITHEGKTYCKQPATNLCVGCDFWHLFGEHHECHAPKEVRCAESIYKELTEADNYTDSYDFEYQFLTKDDIVDLIKFILSVIFIIALTVGSLIAVAHIIINNYK